MRRSRLAPAALCLLLALAGSGCPDPAQGRPEAVAGEAAAPPRAEPSGERFVLGEGTKIGFVGSKVTGSHDGGFNAFQGEILLVDRDPTRSTVRITIDTQSLWADNPKLTGHLKSADFFEVDTYPTATFQSTEIRRENDAYRITGNLDLHGVTRSLSFPANIAVEDSRVTAQAEFSIKRFDFGITYPGPSDNLIRDDVVIKLDLVAVPSA